MDSKQIESLKECFGLVVGMIILEDGTLFPVFRPKWKKDEPIDTTELEPGPIPAE